MKIVSPDPVDQILWWYWGEQNLLNIQMDHIPINLHMSGSLDGNKKLNESAPPSNMQT